MGVIGGRFGYWVLRRFWPDGADHLSGAAYATRDKLEVLLGPSVYEELRDKVVIDFGCGDGHEAIQLAKHGVRKVVGIDIRETALQQAAKNAAAAGVADRTFFAKTAPEKCDVVLSVDSFEHFMDPGAVLNVMKALLKPGGYVLAVFGPTWYHPYGGHLFSVFPWSHLVFTEKALIRWRSHFKDDGATRFGEVAGGLNGMRISRFEKIVRDAGFRFASLELVPIRKLKWAATRLTREVTTAVVRCRLVPQA